ncbi:MAG TPA: glycosyl hydrolase family 28-related protein [Bryobacteraceae bacterium]|nr:glycosyl hydrolase family 28-related protein [Bryobacteraceae bacterium]
MLFWCLAVCAAEFDAARFGAVADGVTDSTAALQAALDAAARAGGGTVVIPPASAPYLLRDTLFIRGSHIEIRGPDATLRLADGAFNGRTKYILFAEGTENAPLRRVVLRGLTIDANYFHQVGSRNSKAVVFRYVEQALVEDVAIAHPYVGLSFRRGSTGAVARRVTVTDYQEDGFDAGGDADEVSGGTVRGVTFVDVTARDAMRCAPGGNAFEIEDGANGVLIQDAVIDHVGGNGVGLRNHVHPALEDHSSDIELRNVTIRRTAGPYSIFVRAATEARSQNSYRNVRLVNVTAESPAAFWGPVRGLVLIGGEFGDILLGLESATGESRASDGVPGAELKDLRARTLRLNGASQGTVLQNVTVPLIVVQAGAKSH